MATSAIHFFPYQTPQRRNFYQIWLPVFFGLTVICFESTPMMGGATTGRWLFELWPRVFQRWEPATYGLVHHLLRKLGHFTGYGTLGLLLRKAWHKSVQIYLQMMGSQLMFAAAALSVSFSFLVGCLDEWHQRMLPGRSSSGWDVLIDTGGALLFNAIIWHLHGRKARKDGTLQFA